MKKMAGWGGSLTAKRGKGKGTKMDDTHTHTHTHSGLIYRICILDIHVKCVEIPFPKDSFFMVLFLHFCGFFGFWSIESSLRISTPFCFDGPHGFRCDRWLHRKKLRVCS